MTESEDPKFYNLEEVEDIAAGVLPKPVSQHGIAQSQRLYLRISSNGNGNDIQAHDYFRTGSDTNTTLRDNRQAFQRFRLIPRVMVNVSKIDLTYELLGRPSQHLHAYFAVTASYMMINANLFHGRAFPCS